MSQPAVPDSADWERRWTVDAGSVIRRLTAVTGAEHGFPGPLPGTDEVRYMLSLT
jgi:hypothetical protein